jgi:hypothetical protein
VGWRVGASGGIQGRVTNRTSASLADQRGFRPTGCNSSRMVPASRQSVTVCHVLVQSSAIEKYIAKLAGVYPEDLKDALITDVLREHFSEAITDILKGGC